MSTADGYQSIFNATSLFTNSSDIIFSDLTANTLLYINSTLNPASVTLGSSLSFTGGTLNTVQGIRTVDSPTFAGLTVGSITGLLKATAGVLSQATVDVDYQRALSSFTNLSYSAGALDLASTITGLTSLTTSTLIVGSQFSVDCIANFYRNYTALGVSNINAAYAGTLTNLAGVGFRNAFGLYCGNTFASNTDNTTSVLHNIFSYPTFDATNATIAYAYGIYAGFAGITGTVDIAYSIYAGAPPPGGSIRAAILTDNLVVGTAGNPPANGILVSGIIKNTNLTASSLVYSDGSYQLGSITLGSNLSLSGATLDTIQGIQTSSSPTFASLTLSSPLSYANGGTGQNSYAAGDIIYASATNTLSKLTIGTAGQVLMVSGGVPAWAASAGVIAVNGTANQIDSSTVSGTVTLSFPSASGMIVPSTYFQASNYASVGITASFNRSFYCSRSYTATSSSAYGATFAGTVTAQAGAITPALYGLSISHNLVSSTGNLTPSLFYGLYCLPSTDATNAAITTAIGSRFGLTTAGTTTYAYTSYIDAPTGTATKNCALYADNIQIGLSGDIIAAGSGKSGYAYIDSRLTIGGQANSIDRCIDVARTYTATTNTPYIYSLASIYTLPAGASANVAHGLRVADSFISNTSNTANTCNALSVESDFKGSPTTIATATGIKSAITLQNTVTTAYGAYITAPSGTTTNKVALYADSIKVGAAVSGNQTTGTIVTTSTGTFSNINLSDFTFNSSLACAASTYTGAGVVYWAGMNSNVNTTMYFSRFGHLVMLRLPAWTYPNTSTSQIPYIGYNPSGWAPQTTILLPVIANHGNSWVRCIMLINTNCTIYLYSPTYATFISATNGVNAFNGSCCVSWSVY